MKTLFQKRWVWFLLGILCMPTLGAIIGLFSSPSPKEAMPFKSIFEESRTEFFFPADYSYSLRSKGSMDEFREFVKKINLDGFRVSDIRYEKKNPNGQHRIVVSYDDGWISYSESQN